MPFLRPHLALLLTASLLGACRSDKGEEEENGSGEVDSGEPCDESAWYLDGDGDGFGVAGSFQEACEGPEGYANQDGDCDDSDASVHPDATESCNGLDDNCDGTVDEGVTEVWYYDQDGDGVGDEGTSVEDCTAPSGFVAVSGDCDDADAGVLGPESWCTDGDGDGFGDASSPVEACDQPSGTLADCSDCDDSTALSSPEGTETCDGLDNDCNGTVDDGTASDASAWFADSDGDGYGDALVVTMACDEPSGSVADATDCDDTDADSYPGAEEACDDADNDCNGAVDDIDSDGDGYFDADCAGDDCDDGDYWVNPAQDETCDNGLDDDCDGTDNGCYLDGDISPTARADFNVSPSGTAWYCGRLVEAAGDADGDGLDDVISLCSYLNSHAAIRYSGSGRTGEVYGYSAYNYGYESATVGDFDNDGLGDVVFGNLWTGFYTAQDRVSVFDSAPLGAYGATGYDHVYSNTSDGTQEYGSALGATDLNGDGMDDLLIGAYGADNSETNGGAVWIHYGPLSGGSSSPATDYDAVLLAEGQGDYLGWDVKGVGDLDGDGYEDLVVGAPYADGETGTDSGAAYIVLGSASMDEEFDLSTDAQARLDGASAHDYAGFRVDGGRDADGDGLPDVMVGVPDEGSAGEGSGAAYLVSGLVSGTMSLDSAAFATFYGSNEGDEAGYDMAILGDIDGDGDGDIVVGAPGVSDTYSAQGATYVIYGPLSGDYTLGSDADAAILGPAAGARSGNSVAAPGDTNGDGRQDLLFNYNFDSERGYGIVFYGSAGM